MNDPEYDEDDDEYANFNETYFARVFEHEKMISDTRRMDFYNAIITSNIQDLASSNNNQGPIVLDVGTGTGVLAAWAEKAGASKVVAIDHSESCIKLAATLADANQCTKIDFMVGHSSQYESEQKVDIILHEQIGDILFDEYMVKTITDLKTRVLKKGGRIVPSLFSLFIEPVQLDANRHVSMMSNIKSHGLDFQCLQDHVESQDVNPDYYHFRSSDSSLIDHFLTKPSSCWDIDLNTITEEETSSKTELKWKKNATKAGRLDALCVYFASTNREEHTNTITDTITSGPTPDRCTHWGFRCLRLHPLTVEKGDELEFTVTVTSCWEDIQSWRWSVAQNGEPPKIFSTDGSSTNNKKRTFSETETGNGNGAETTSFMTAEDLAALRGNDDAKKQKKR